MAGADWSEPAQAPPLKNMVGFRNVLVHGYDDVNLNVVRSILASHLTDLEAFVSPIRRRL